VICEGSGSGEDGTYANNNSYKQVRETNNSQSMAIEKSYLGDKRKGSVVRRDSSEKEVGRRILQGWQLLDSPCPKCMSPLMSESSGGPEVCVFCKPEEDIELGEDNFCDDSPRCSAKSITLNLQGSLEASDPVEMEELVHSVTGGAISRRSRSVSSRRSRSKVRLSQRRDGPDITFNSRLRSTRDSTPKNRLPPSALSSLPSRQRYQQMEKIPARNRNRSQSPRLTPKNRHIESSSPVRSLSRDRSSYTSNLFNHLVGTEDAVDASCLTDERRSEYNALNVIVHQIEACKDKFTEPLAVIDVASMRNGTASRNETFNLIEQLSASAIAGKKI